MVVLKLVLEVVYFVFSLSLVAGFTFPDLNVIDQLFFATNIMTLVFTLGTMFIFRDIVGGLSIMLDKPFKEGDEIEVNHKRGTVSVHISLYMLYSEILNVTIKSTPQYMHYNDLF